jgi:SAM-dependent methyltransferase
MVLKDVAKKILDKAGYAAFDKHNLPFYFQTKYRAEISFWKDILKEYELWYDGKRASLYEEPAPGPDQRVNGYNHTYNAILTWLKIHQETKYLEDLHLQSNAFTGMKLLDIGSGPIPSAQVYTGTELYCLDPLIPLYLEAGFPGHIYDPRVKLVFGFSEKMPFQDHFFDAIISVNALDHVDDFHATAREIERVLKPGGKMRFHLHYHDKTVTEPLELNDAIVAKAFGWCKDFKRISDSRKKRGYTLTDEKELYTVWSNF